MSDIKTVLREMVVRLAKHEVNIKVRPLEKKIKEMNLAGRQMQKLIDRQQKEISALSKNIPSDDKIKTLPPEALEKSRLSPKLISVLRKKLKLTGHEFAKLLGASSNAVFRWESGKSKPRSAYRAKIISLRSMGKREIRQILKGSKA